MTPCWRCGGVPSIEGAYVGFHVYCSNCYDVDWQGEEDGYRASGPSVHGMTKAAAIVDWNEAADEAIACFDWAESQEYRRRLLGDLVTTSTQDWRAA